MSEPAAIRFGAGEIIGDSSDRRVEILSDHDSLHATWSRFGPYRDGADLHVHRLHSDFFYVLSGELTIRLGPEGEERVLSPGTLAGIPRLVVHGFRNGSDAEVTYLNLHAPGQGFADFLRGLRDGENPSYDQYPPPPDGGGSVSEAAIGERELLVDEPGHSVALLAGIETITIAEIAISDADPGEATESQRDIVASFYVLEGELMLRLDGQELRGAPGSWIQLPAGARYRVEGFEPVRYLRIHTPGSGSRMIHDDGR